MHKAFPCFNPGIYEADDPLWPQNGWDIGPEALGRIFYSIRLKQIGLRIAYEMLRECGVYENFLASVEAQYPQFLVWLQPWSERVWEVLNLENPTEEDWDSIAFLELPVEDVEQLLELSEVPFPDFGHVWWTRLFVFLFAMAHIFEGDIFDDKRFFHAIHNAATAYSSMYVLNEDRRYDQWSFIRLSRRLHPGWSEETQMRVEIYLISVFWDEWRERCMQALAVDRYGQHEISGFKFI